MTINKLTTILCFFIGITCHSQAPEKINYQAVVRDGNGNILPNTVVPITIDVVNGVNTCAVYSGSQTTNSYGLINIELDLSACTIDWSTGTATLSSSINSVSGTSNLNSVPYSIYSSISDSTANYPKSAADGDILVWSSSIGKWEATTNAGGGSSISDTDGDTQIQTEESNDEDVIRFDIDGQERMVIKANGKVGIGTSSPSSPLEIKSDQDGAFTLNKDGATAWNYIQYKNSGTRYFYTGVTNLEKFVFGSDNGKPFYFTGSKVGISLNDPKANLDVQDTLRVSREDRQYTEIINSSAAGAIIQAVSGEDNKKPLSIDALYEIETNPAAGANQIRFRTGEISSPSTKMTIDEDGEVGIGTTTPDYKLDVRGDLGIKNASSTRTNLKLINSSSSQYSRGSLSFINSNTASGTDDNGFSINYEKADASSSGNSTVIFRQGETNSDYLDYLQFSETTKNITFNANKSSTSSSSFGDVIVAEGNLQLNTGAGVNEFSTDGTLSGNSDNAVPTEKAVKTYVDNNSSTADGSETIISAGTNVSVSGTGTASDPYVVSSTDNDIQNISEVLSQGSIASDGQAISIDQVNAIDGDGLKLYEDAGKGIFIEDGGNVGIGTSTNNSLYNGGAKTKLEVVSSVTATGSGPYPINWAATLTNASNSSVGGNSIGLKFKGSDHYTTGSINKYAGIAAVEDSQGSGSTGFWGNISLTFHTVENPSSTTAPTEKMRLNAQGYLGIGTTTPSSELDVNGDASITGSLGIGTSNPSSELEVNGGVRITGLSGGSVDMMVVANSDGDLSTQAISFGASSIGELSDGSYGYSGSQNLFLGSGSGANNISDGYHNTGVGTNSLNSITTAKYNTALGSHSLKNNTANFNTGIGYSSMHGNTDGAGNLAVGYAPMYYGTSGNQYNVAIGMQSMRGIDTDPFQNAERNVAVGYRSMYEMKSNATNSTTNNTAVGYGSMYKINGGNYNTAIGYQALYDIDNGERNTALGYHALQNNTTGSYNTGTGMYSLNNNISGAYNTALGYAAGYSNITGEKNVFIGYQAGYFETDSNKLYISNSNTSTPLIKGDFSAKELEIKAATKIIRQDGDNYIEFSADISGNYITSDAPTNNQKALYISSNPSTTSGTKPIYFRTDNSTRMTLHGDGNIGIGTTDPKAPLDIPEMGGLILGLTDFDCDKVPTTTFTKLDDTYGKVVFVAPSSGNVIIEVSLFVQDGNGTSEIRLIDQNNNLYENAYGGYLSMGNSSSIAKYHWDVIPFIVTGLTAGTQYTMYPEIAGTNSFYILGGMIKAVSAPSSSYILIE